LICDIWLPINKKLWTSSFALFMAGLDFIAFAMFLWFVDGLGKKAIVKPLVLVGMNAIAVYMASEAVDILFGQKLRGWFYQLAPAASGTNASLVYALTYTGLMFLLAYGMYRKRWFVRI